MLLLVGRQADCTMCAFSGRYDYELSDSAFDGARVLLRETKGCYRGAGRYGTISLGPKGSVDLEVLVEVGAWMTPKLLVQHRVTVLAKNRQECKYLWRRTNAFRNLSPCFYRFSLTPAGP